MTLRTKHYLRKKMGLNTKLLAAALHARETWSIPTLEWQCLSRTTDRKNLRSALSIERIVDRIMEAIRWSSQVGAIQGGKIILSEHLLTFKKTP